MKQRHFELFFIEYCMKQRHFEQNASFHLKENGTKMY